MMIKDNKTTGKRMVVTNAFLIQRCPLFLAKIEPEKYPPTKEQMIYHAINAETIDPLLLHTKK